jgi:hypothetical protein
MVSALLSDMYQITMAYAYWKVHKYNDNYGQLCAKMIIFGQGFCKPPIFLFLFLLSLFLPQLYYIFLHGISISASDLSRLELISMVGILFLHLL